VRHKYLIELQLQKIVENSKFELDTNDES
jgi:hypothetical protein